jgi:hypothetical protein
VLTERIAPRDVDTLPAQLAHFCAMIRGEVAPPAAAAN